ncbi:MAG: methionine synthase [Oscillospiraceae bacterium]
MIEIEKINREEALRYLACNNEKAREDLAPLIDECEKELLSVLSPKFTYRYFDISFSDKKVYLKDTDIFFEGNDIFSHLDSCRGAYLIAATLGSGVDRLIRKLQIENMAKAVVTDALASAAVEEVCALAENEIKNRSEKGFFTWRYAPGYGDFDINIQKDFLSLLDAQKKIGLYTSDDTMLLTPIKSVTSVMGVSDTPLPPKKRGCITCNMKDSCAFRKRGSHCEY